MDVLSFYVTAPILALSFDVGLFFQAVLLWLGDRGGKIEKMKKKKKRGGRQRTASLFCSP